MADSAISSIHSCISKHKSELILPPAKWANKHLDHIHYVCDTESGCRIITHMPPLLLPCLETIPAVFITSIARCTVALESPISFPIWTAVLWGLRIIQSSILPARSRLFSGRDTSNESIISFWVSNDAKPFFWASCSASFDAELWCSASFSQGWTTPNGSVSKGFLKRLILNEGPKSFSSGSLSP